MNLIFTFDNPAEITYQLLEFLKAKYWEKYFIDIDRLDEYFNKIALNNYQYILGLGNYYSKAKCFRIQQKFVNKRRGKFIFQNGIWEYEPSWRIRGVRPNSAETFDVETDIGNKVSYMTMHVIKQKKLKSKFAFLYIPTNADFQKSSVYLKEVINYEEPSPIVW